MNKTSGILKKTNYKENNVELLCFGYSCKLFKDDLKALEIDRENHLIPAPYDAKEMISRYDVRATLSEPPEYFNHDTSTYLNRTDYLSASEQQAELLAEEERYYSLYQNEVEEELYREEKEKREKNSGYNQIAFNYDEVVDEAFGPQVPSVNNQDEMKESENDDDPFVASANLKIPPDMECPKTIKLNQIMEKTAKFIASQGSQMEILLKTKQAGNPQFNFLNHDDPLNAYYKHILLMMRNNTYPWEETRKKADETLSKETTENETNDVSVEPSLIVIPKIQYKPSADCTYTQLISKITKAPISELEKKKEEEKSKNIEAPKISSGLLGLVQNYNSDSESEQEEDPASNFNGSIPPADIQIVIDKTASYVAKNGTDFEQKLICKNDARFSFLCDQNEYNEYYKMKVKHYSLQFPPKTPSLNISSSVPKEIILPKVPPAPVNFRIKTKEDRPALKSSMDVSDDEKIIPEKIPSPPKISVEEELERQVDDVNAKREEKLAKERLSDKLLSAAREKLRLVPKKVLQSERKKKALMFINQIKESNGSSSQSNAVKEGEEVINLTQHEDESNDSGKSLKISKSSSRSRKRSSSRSSSRSASSRSSDSSPRRKRSKKTYKKRKHENKSRSRSRERKHSSRKEKRY